MDNPTARYLVICEQVKGIFGLFDDLETASRKAGEWTEDYGLAFIVCEHTTAPLAGWNPKDKPEGWFDHLLRRLKGGK